MASHQGKRDGCRLNGDCISATASKLFLERSVHRGLSINFVCKCILKINHELWMIGTWHSLRIFQTSWKASPLPTKHFIQTSISISNQRVVLCFFSYQSLQTSCRGDRHSALSLAPCRPTYGKVKKGSAAQTMCFCCLFPSVLLGWCSSCPTDNVFWS